MRMNEAKVNVVLVPGNGNVMNRLGDNNAKISFGRDVKHGVGYGEYSTGCWVSITLTCNQAEEELRKGAATAKYIADKIIEREDARLLEQANRVALEIASAGK